MKKYLGYRNVQGILNAVTLAGGLGLISAAVFLWGSEPQTRILELFLINLIAVLSISIYSGNTGVLTFGHVAFMGIGAYSSGILTLPAEMKAVLLPHLPEAIRTVSLGMEMGILIGVGVVIAVTCLVGILFAMLKPAAASISTLCLLIIVHNILVGASDWTRGSASFFGIDTEINFGLLFGLVIFALLAAELFRVSSWGRCLRASVEDEKVITSFGVNLFLPRYASFILSGVVMAIAGSLLAHYLGSFSPKTFYFHQTFVYLAMIIIGGWTSTTGAVGGTILITLILEVLRKLEQGGEYGGIEFPQIFGLTNIGLSLATLFVLYKFKQGIFGGKEFYEYLPEKIGKLFTGMKTEGHPDPVEWKSSPQTLRVTGLVKTFSGVNALQGVDMELHTGEIVGLIGPNGSGKTTLVNTVTGILTPTGGKITIGDTDMTQEPLYQSARQGLTRTYQNINLFKGMTVRENVEASITFLGYSQNQQYRYAQNILRLTGLEKYERQEVSSLPYGVQKRVEIARTLACRPQFMFLDEPAAGMNSSESAVLMKDLRDWVSRFGFGLLIIDHDMHLIMNLCDRIMVLEQGKKIAEGPPDEIKHNPRVQEAYFGKSKIDF